MTDDQVDEETFDLLQQKLGDQKEAQLIVNHIVSLMGKRKARADVFYAVVTQLGSILMQCTDVTVGEFLDNLLNESASPLREGLNQELVQKAQLFALEGPLGKISASYPAN
jgi:hypothetical protein